jgi:hypothetical protein
MSTRIPQRGQTYHVQQAIPRDLHGAFGAKQVWKVVK